MLGNIVSAANGAMVALNSYDSWATATVSGTGTAAIGLSGISSNYEHLEIRLSVGDNSGIASPDLIKVWLNGDTTAGNYIYNFYETDGTTLTTSTNYLASHAAGGKVYSIATAAENPSVFVLRIMNYKDTTKFKNVQVFGAGVGSSAVGRLGFYGSVWGSTAAITQVTLALASGNNFADKTTMAIYGIKVS